MRIVINSWSRFMPPYIPDDVMFNILSWLPSKSLIRFKSVCKAWHAMISSPCFTDAHLECSKRNPSILMVPGAYEKQEDGENIAFMMVLYKYHGGKTMELVHMQNFPLGIGVWTRPVHCNGLLLIPTMNLEMMICNPSTRQIVFLPKVSGNICTGTRAGFGFDPHSNKYKVARSSYQRDSETQELVCKFEVLTLGTNAWRQTEDPPYPIDALTPVHVKGAIYWIVCSSLCPDPPNAFLRFCLTDEKFSLFPCPPSNVKSVRFTEVEGELCCACFFSETLALEIWNCSGGQNLEWTRRYVIQIPPDVVMKYPVERPPLIVFREKMLLLAFKKVYRYDIETCTIVELASKVSDFTCYEPYLEKEARDLHLFNYAETGAAVDVLLSRPRSGVRDRDFAEGETEIKFSWWFRRGPIFNFRKSILDNLLEGSIF
uniref:F-box domain-containing protein n=1 Tax=Oryza nivara TaxID=4536 RepID=A0A0E0IKR7_ORYNI